MASSNDSFIFEDSDLSECYLTTVWRLILTDVQRVVVASTLGLAIPPAILVNVLLCLALVKTKQASSPSKFLFVILCISDSFSGMVSIPVSVTIFTYFGQARNCWFEMASMFLGQTNGHFSFYLILAIAVQRYIKIKNTMSEHFLVTSAGAKTLAVGCFVWSTCHGLVSTFFFGHVQSRLPNVFMMLIRTFITISIYVCYFCLYRSVKKHTKATAKWNKSDDKTECGIQRSKNHMPNLFRTIYLILIVLCVCYIPLIVMDLWTGYYSLIEGTPAPQWPRFFYYLMHFPLFANYSLNAGIFLYRNKECKTYLKNLLFRCDKSCNASVKPR